MSSDEATRGGPAAPAPVPPAVRRLAAIAVAGLAVWFVVANRGELRGVGSALRSATPVWLAAGIALVGLWLLNHASFQAAAQRAVGLSASGIRLLGPAAAATFLNIVVKSGGMAGLAALRREGRDTGKALGKVTAAYLLVIVSGEVAFTAVLLLALMLMLADGRLSVADVVAAAMFGAYLAGRLGVLIAATRSREATRRLAAAPGRAWARVRHRPPPSSHPEAADEVYDAVQVLRARPSAAVPVLVRAAGVEVIGVAMVWVSVLAVGVHVHVGVPLVAYAVSVLFTIVGFLPGGLGTVELSMTAVLIASGVAAADAAAAVVVYRILELWLPLAVGALAARRRGLVAAG